MDGAEHRALRNKLGDLLSGSRVHSLLEACRSPLDEMAQQLTAGASVDLVRVMRTLSGRLALEMMGVTPNDGTADQAAREIVVLGERLSSEFRFRPLSGRRLRTVQADVDRLTAYARKAWDSDAVRETSIVHRLRELGLSFEETRGIVSIFFIAGTITTALALPRIVALLIDSGQMARLRDRDAIGRAVDEGLRYVAPVPVTVRIANRGVMLRGREIPVGTRLLVFTSNLTRDASVFPDAARFDIDRVHDARGRHLWYGAGPHFCFGFVLAQRQLQRALETLAALPGRLAIQRRRPAFRTLLAMYECLDVRLERA
jgi:cytochrome P450